MLDDNSWFCNASIDTRGHQTIHHDSESYPVSQSRLPYFLWLTLFLPCVFMNFHRPCENTVCLLVQSLSSVLLLQLLLAFTYQFFFIIIISLSNLSISFPSWSIQRATDDRVARTGFCGTLLKTLSPCPEKNSLLVICQLLSANVLDTGNSFWLHSEIAKNCMWNVRGDS